MYEAADLVSASHERFESRAMTGERCNNRKMMCVWDYAPHGVFCDRRLRRHMDFASVIAIDWVHCMLQFGVLNVHQEGV